MQGATIRLLMHGHTQPMQTFEHDLRIQTLQTIGKHADAGRKGGNRQRAIGNAFEPEWSQHPQVAD